MPLRSTLVLLAAGAALAGPADAEELKQVGTIPIPGTPVVQFGILAVNQSTGLGYLADKDNKGVVVFDTRTDTFVTRIPGFVGITKNGDASGPNGVVVVNGGAEVWVSDGDSTIKVIDGKSNAVTATFATGGRIRANGMAFDPDHKVVIVANSNDEPPFLSLISSEPGHRILARIPIAESGENLERSAYHAPSGMFYTVIPVLRADTSKGIMAQVDARNGKLVKLHEIERCHPHSLSIVSDSTIFLGCSTAHGDTPKPGGDLAIFDIASGKVASYGEGLGGNGSSTVNLTLGRYYHSTTNAALFVIDTRSGKLVQNLRTSNGARSLGVSLANNKVYVATNAKDGPCGGCIVVYSAE
ncbi:MAG: hypothetical protein QOI12_3032 [Alphaproteobacteria bacterium]|jgi:DNA-binding beta-propeller fold protein YncE|nr:hypothetical protein [Alphaproteobacteria bacterium]